MGKSIGISTLRNYPLSNMNRDMDGSPKAYDFGGVKRSELSSQTLKRAVRLSSIMKDVIGEDTVGIRTRRTDIVVFEELAKRGDYTQYHEEINKLLNSMGKKKKEDKASDNEDDKVISGTKTMQMYSNDDISTICDIIVNAIEAGESIAKIDLDKELAKTKEQRKVSLDIALFGRMAPTNSFSTVEAALQVAHAFSTNKATIENDYFTAVDDVVERQSNESGSGHLGDTECTSACYYHYFNLDIEQLAENLKTTVTSEEDMERIIRQLIKAICIVTPSGKQNSFAAFSMPSLVSVEVKKTNTPISYANAFVTPCKTNNDGNIVENSVKALATYMDTVDTAFGIEKTRFWMNVDGKKDVKPADCQEVTNLDNLIELVIKEVKGA